MRWSEARKAYDSIDNGEWTIDSCVKNEELKDKSCKSGYKMTELGEIPDGWQVKSVNEVADVNPESLSNKTNKDVIIQYIDIESVTTGKIADIKQYAFGEAPSRARRIVRKDDIIVSTVRPYLKAFAMIKSNKQNLVCSTGFAVLRAKNKISSKYIYQYTLSDDFLAQLSNKMVGSNYPAVNSSDIKETLVPVPSFEEQQKIASILSSVDEQIEITDNLIEKTKELKKGLMQRLLTKGIGHSRFKDTEIGRIPVEWEVRKLGEIAEIIMGQSPDSSSYNEDGEGIPFFQGKTEFGTIHPVVKKWCTKPTKIAKPFDILISVRAPVGDVNINNINSCIGRGLGVIRQTNESYYKYIYYTLQIYQNELKKFSQGSTFEAINSSDLKRLKIPVPVLQEQQKIASILSSVDEQINQYESKKEKLQELKKGFMQKLLTGKIRVKV